MGHAADSVDEGHYLESSMRLKAEVVAVISLAVTLDDLVQGAASG